MIRKNRGLIIILFSILFIIGCSSKSSDSQSDPSETADVTENGENADNGSTDSETSQSSEEDNMPVSPAEPLDMEEDDLSLDDLIKLVGVPFNEVQNALELEEGISEKEGVIFGETVKVTLNDSDDICSSMQLSFLGTPMESLQNAISEQLGDDGNVVEDGILWTTENSFILLYESAEGCYVDIGLE